MPTASVIISREPTRQVILVQPVKNQFGISQYEQIKITKTGYLWGYVRLGIIEGQGDGLAKEKIAFVDKDFMIESVKSDLIVLKRINKKLQLFREFKQDKNTGVWESIKNSR